MHLPCVAVAVQKVASVQMDKLQMTMDNVFNQELVQVSYIYVDSYLNINSVGY